MGMTRNEAKTIIKNALYNRQLTKQELSHYLRIPLSSLSPMLMKFVLDGTVQYNKGKYYLPPIYRIDYIVIIAIRVVMEVIGIGAAIISVRYTSIWLFEFLPVFWAWMLSSLMVFFSVIAFQLLIIFLKKKNYFLTIVLSILWIIVLIFSMGSTIAGQYNARAHTLRTNIVKQTSATTNKILYEQYRQQERELLDNIENKKTTIERYQKLLVFFDSLEKRTENKKDYDNITWGLAVAEKELSGFSGQLKSIREKIEILLTKDASMLIISEVEKLSNFYTWLGAIFSISENVIQFWLSLFPAIFIDIIAPCGIAVGLFLKQKEE